MQTTYPIHLEPYAPTPHRIDVTDGAQRIDGACSCGWSTSELIVPGHSISAYEIVARRLTTHRNAQAVR